MEEGRYAEARTTFDSGLALAQQTTSQREEAMLCCSLAELDIFEGELEQALARFAEAHALAVRMELLDTIELTTTSALWTAVLLDNRKAIQTWQQPLERPEPLQQLQARGRLALAHSLLLLQRPAPDLDTLADLTAVATTAEHIMIAPERACLALLHATLAFTREGWAGAAAAWERFEAQAASLPETLLRCFVQPYRTVFVAAAGSSRLARRLVARSSNAPTPASDSKPVPIARADGLTAREIEVLRLLAEGLTNAEIARRLVISRRTVDWHLSSIYGKLDVSSRSAATRHAIDHGLV
jgi:ATP/maltotriose-dependent transcriptional regulator MalT